MVMTSGSREHRRLVVGDNGFEVNGLIKKFGRTTAVDGVSLSAPGGHVLALLGPNGAGKTTVVRVLATLLRPDAGQVRVAGIDVRIQGSIPAALGATGLAILFGFCLSWVTVFIGVIVKSAEAVPAFSFIAFLPLQLGSSLASPTDTLPGWLKAWADINPVTHVMDACRALLNGTPDAGSIGRTLLWSAILFVIFCPLAVRAYGRQE
jgi:energy-coupling factor transporter ATP-binding protein EcfA2